MRNLTIGYACPDVPSNFRIDLFDHSESGYMDFGWIRISQASYTLIRVSFAVTLISLKKILCLPCVSPLFLDLKVFAVTKKIRIILAI